MILFFSFELSIQSAFTDPLAIPFTSYFFLEPTKGVGLIGSDAREDLRELPDNLLDD
jgi:hypothetical protein